MVVLLDLAYVNIFRRIAKGSGRMRSTKRPISATRSRKTLERWSAPFQELRTEER
jgi:hypothetical protein